MIILVNVVLNRTVVDSDIHFKNPINKLKLITEFIFTTVYLRSQSFTP